MLASEAEHPLPALTFRTLSPNHTLEVPFLGTRMMLNGQLKRYHSASIAFEWREKVVIIRVAVSRDSFFGKRLQV
jgi:hypothetical protein